ncbi:cation:proton antiporter [Pediococcus pentosaceus]
MNLLISTFIIFVVVALSNLIARYFPKFPNTYINLIAGILIGFFPAIDHLILPFHNDVFMILILAPLLFFEGQVTPVLMIRKKVNSIIGTAVILALETAIVATLIINKIFVLGVPFALIIVAIITPTDATAFDSVVQGRKIQQTIQNVLKTESLFNDATGIVLLQAAILWLQTGHLKLVYNFAIFIKMVIGGAFIGMILAFLLVGVRQYFVRSANNVISSQTLIYLLTPFCIYFTAEKLGTSGIIAVVVAGLVHNSEINRSRFSSPRQVRFWNSNGKLYKPNFK